MDIGDQLRVLTVEPVVSPVPDRDLPGRSAETRPVPPRPSPRSGAGVGEHDLDVPAPRTVP